MRNGPLTRVLGGVGGATMLGAIGWIAYSRRRRAAMPSDIP
jgi:hypothetical protein